MKTTKTATHLQDLNLYTPGRRPEALRNLTYSGQFTTTDLIAAAEQSATGAELIRSFKKLGMTERLDITYESATFLRIKVTSAFDGEHYLEAKKA